MFNHHKYGATYTNKHGRRHRTNGPAILYFDGRWSWCLDGLAHRYYGPATRGFAAIGDNPNGNWTIHGKRIH